MIFSLSQAAEGTGLAFIIFTQAIVELPGAPFWSCIFFMMLLALGLGSQIGLLEGMLCVIFDIDLFKRIKKQYMAGKRNLPTVHCQKATDKKNIRFNSRYLQLRSCLRRMLFRGAHLLYWRWRILAEDV